MDTLLAPTDLLPQTGFRIWGIDPSSKRIAVAQVETDGAFTTRSVSLPPNTDRATRFTDGFATQVEFFRTLTAPAMVFLEEPFIPRDRRQIPTHLLMYGVTLAALGEVLGPIPVVELTTSQWKARAMGQGNGHADKFKIMDWARSMGYVGGDQDEADALGVAIGGAQLFLSQQRAAAA